MHVKESGHLLHILLILLCIYQWAGRGEGGDKWGAGLWIAGGGVQEGGYKQGGTQRLRLQFNRSTI